VTPRSTLWALLALAAGCGGAAADGAAPPFAPAGVPEATGTRVEIATLQTSEARLQLRLPGEVAGSRDALLAAPAGGFVESVHVKRGEAVAEGQTIARLNTAMYAAQREQARAQQLHAKAELERVMKMGDLATDAQRLAATTQLSVAEAGLRLADVQLSRSVIRAPFSGVLVQLDLEVGEVAAPSAPIARVVQLDPVFVSVSVSDRDVGVLREGMEVQVNVDAVPGSVTGTVKTVDRAADLETRTFLAEVEVPNPEGRLLPGMIASIGIEAGVDGSALVLPQDWLVTSMQGLGVFVEEDGVARWRPVRAGALVHDQLIIEEGLAAGDRIVITGQRGLADGDRLLISREGVCCTHGRATF